MSLDQEIQVLIKEEESCLAETIDKLNTQYKKACIRLNKEQNLARELTAEYVNATRDEDKQLLAVDEAVAHSITHLKAEEIDTIESLIKNPYFARITLEEELNGKIQLVEYKLGKKANIDCRIIDWKNAPLAKLYYEYQEGDEYSEEVKERIREGKILKKIAVDIKDSKLKAIRRGNQKLQLIEGSWRSEAKMSRDYSSLPDILSLITKEQFQSITQDLAEPVIIQGIAGSGKSTVALYRLAYLIEHNQHNPQNCLILLRSKILRFYIEKSLQLLEINSPVKTVDTAINDLAKKILGITISNFTLDYSLAKILNSKRLLKIMTNIQATSYESACELILNSINSKENQTELNKDFITANDINLLKNILANKESDYLSVILSLCAWLNNPTQQQSAAYEQVVVDEFQDLSIIESYLVSKLAKKKGALTIVGDSAQDLSAGFSGWNFIAELLGIQADKIIKLEVSHRCTKQIISLAFAVKRSDHKIDGRNGRLPIWFKELSESRAITRAIAWLEIALTKYSGSLTAVLTADRKIARDVYKMLEAKFSHQISLLNDSQQIPASGLLVGCIEDAKGLEFTNVIIWNPDNTSFENSEESRSLLYVAITRAEENLALISYRKTTALLPAFGSKYYRSIEPDED